MFLTDTAASSAPVVPAALDPALPRLPQILDGPALHGVLGAVRSAQVTLHDLWYVPGERCLATYVIAAGEPGGGAPLPSEFLVLEVDADGLRCRELREDPALPGLATVLDPTAVRLRLRETTGVEAERCRVVPVRYRPEQRCVVRFDLITTEGPRSYFGKLMREGAGRAAAATNAIRAHAEREAGLACVPSAIAWPDVELVLTEAAPGRTLSRLLTALLAAPEPESHEHAQRLLSDLGSLLGLLHTTPGVDVPAYGPAEQLAELAGYLPLVSRADPPTAAQLGRLVDRLARTPPATDEVVLGHGSFRTGQVVAGPDGLTLFDLDGLYRGDPARDVGNALAYLTWKGLQRSELRPGVTKLLAALPEGYRARGLPLDEGCLRWWQAASLLKIAARRYRQLAVSQWPLVPLLLHEAETTLANGHRQFEPAQAIGAPRKPMPLASLDGPELTRLIRLLPERGTQGRATVVAAQVVAQAPGRRTVVRCELAADGRSAPTAPIMLKEYADAAKAARAYRNLVELASGPFARTPQLKVPAPLGWLPNHGIVAYREAAGETLDRVLPAARARAAASTAALWLAVLHGSDLDLPHRLDLSHHIADTRRWVEIIAGSDAELAHPARGLADRLTAAATALDWRDDVTTHFDLHPGHVLIGPTGGVTVLDLDEARMGDPVFDVAHFCVYLELLGLAGSPHWQEMRWEFVDSYAALTQWRLDDRFHVFAAYAWLKVAKQLACGSGPWRPVGGARLAGLRAALERGASCLDR